MEIIFMKKCVKLFFVGLFVIAFFPRFVAAKEYCEVVGGTGKTLGSELKCGTESFYVVKNMNGMLYLFAKYNLNVGDKIDLITIEENQPVYSSDSYDYCRTLAEGKGYHPYYVYPLHENFNEDGQSYSRVTGCRVYEVIDEGVVHQDERAQGTKLVNGKSQLPLYGITYMNPEWGYDAIVNNVIKQNVYDNNGDLIISGSSFEKYLNDYRAELESQGLEVQYLGFATLRGTINLLEEISGEEIEVNLEYPQTWSSDGPPEDNYIAKMDIKKYLGNNYEWLYDRTYWLGSGYKFNGQIDMDYYISNEGMLCALGRGECVPLPYPVGNGVRPLVVIAESDIKYSINTHTDGNGTIEVVNYAAGNATIQFKVVSKKGYTLSKLIVKTDSGEQIEFNKGSIVNNLDGTISIDKNKFTMPYENVTIEAKWELDLINPATGRHFALLLVLIIPLVVAIVYINKKQHMLKK